MHAYNIYHIYGYIHDKILLHCIYIMAIDGYTHSTEGDVSRRIVQATAPQCPECTEANNWFAPRRVELPLFSYFSYSQQYFSDFVNCISRILIV